MKKITLKLASVTLVLAMLITALPFSISAEEATNPATEEAAVVTTKTYDFSDSSQLDDFYSYYWSDSTGQIRDADVTDSYKLANGVLSRTRDYNPYSNDGVINHITALTFKDVEFKNFDLSFEMQYDVASNSYTKYFYVGMREILPGQPSDKVTGYMKSKDANGNDTNNIYINLYGKVSLGSGIEAASTDVESSYGKMCKYRVKAVGTDVSVWVYDTDGDPDYTFTATDGIIDRTGTLSLCFLDAKGAIDNISITNLDEDGNAAAFPVASTKKLIKNKAAKNSVAGYYRDFITETWENVDGSGVYTTYSDLNSAAYFFDDYNNLITTNLGHTNEVSADNMAALTVNDSRMKNFEATVTLRFWDKNLKCCGNFAINMREQEPGKLFANTYTESDKWPGTAKMSDGTYTAALITNGENTNVNVCNKTTTIVATRTAEDFSTMHTYKVKLVGDTLYTWVDGVQGETVSGLELKDKGYLSFISSNQRVVINALSVTWLDDDGNPAEWGSGVDSTREWFGSADKMDLSEFRASYWDSDNGYVSTVPAVIGNSTAAWKSDTFWKNTGWYTLEPLYDNRYNPDSAWLNGSWADNMAALTLNDNSFRNFEVEVKVVGNVYQSNPIMISAREKTPGQPVSTLKNWKYGRQQDLSENVVLKYFTSDATATINSGSSSQSISGIVNTTDNGFASNTLKLRVVGNTATAWVNGENQGTLQLSDYCEESGYISIIFANVNGGLNKLKVTRLDEDGNPIDYNTGKQLFINTAADFAKIGNHTAYPVDGNYWLTDDIVIDENNPWTSVAKFSGSLNGDGHTVKGLTSALIHTATGDATVCNLVIKDINSPDTGNDNNCGAVIRYVKGTAAIENVAVTGKIYDMYAGAFVGRIDSNCKLTVNNCSFGGIMLANYIGGYIGQCLGTAIINNSYSDFTVSWALNSWNYAIDDASVTVNNAYYKRTINGNAITNYSDDKPLETLGLPSEYWVHDGKSAQLKITGAENYTVGDVNLDKTVDILDLIVLKKMLANISGVNGSILAANLDGKFDDDGVASVNADDLTILRRNLLLNITNNYKTYSIALTGKSALYLGDSIAHGANDTADGSAVAGNPLLDQPDKLAWCGRISEEYGMTGKNVAMSGWSLARDHKMSIIVNEFNNVGNVEDYDFVILHGGVNDVWHSQGNYDCGAIALGELTANGATEFDTTTLYGALENLVYTAKQKAPNAKIGYIINPDISGTISSQYKEGVINFNDMVTAIKAVCDKYGIKYLDFPSNEEFNKEFNNATHLIDGVHPTSAGYDIIYKYVAKWMETL